MSNNVFKTNLFRKVLIGVAGFVVLVFVFGFGVFVGCEKAEFSYKWAEQYHRNFAGPKEGFLGNFSGKQDQFANSNGVFGQIVKIDSNVLTVKDSDGDKAEKNILISQRTIIVTQRKNIKISNLKIGDNIVAIGSPNSSGQMQAELIRVMPIQK